MSQIVSRTYTVATSLTPTPELEEYLTAFKPAYNQVQRRVFQDLKHGVLKTMTRSEYVSSICRRFNMLKRTVNSIINDMSGRIQAYTKLKETELEELKLKIGSVEAKIVEKEKIVREMKPRAAANQLNERGLQTYRGARESLYHLRNRLNEMKQDLENRTKDLQEGRVSICFGTKAFFAKQCNLEQNGFRSHTRWHNEFVKKRDSGIFFLGSGDESYGNQILQLRPGDGEFTMVLLKDKSLRKKRYEDITLEHVRFRYMQDELRSAIENGQPITYRISKKGCKWYLTAMFRKEVPLQTVRDNGVFGVDFNNGFLEVAETDCYGNLVSGMHIPLEYHGTGNKAESEIKEKLSKLVRHARDQAKDIIVEDLNFIKKKAKTLKAKGRRGKKYNSMIHLLDYSRYLFWMQNLCVKYGVGYLEVNPAYTSRIGKKKYAESRKLTVHRAAALVIGRRGQGFRDR